MELLIFIFKLCFSLLSADVLVSAFVSFTVSLAVLQQCNWSPPNQGLYWLHVVRPWLRFRGTRRSVHPLTDVWSPDVTRRPWWALWRSVAAAAAAAAFTVYNSVCHRLLELEAEMPQRLVGWTNTVAVNKLNCTNCICVTRKVIIKPATIKVGLLYNLSYN